MLNIGRKNSRCCSVKPRRNAHCRGCYSPSSLSNTIVLRNEESGSGRSVLGSSSLHRSVYARLELAENSNGIVLS